MEDQEKVIYLLIRHINFLNFKEFDQEVTFVD
jgi:hypothetical protein